MEEPADELGVGDEVVVEVDGFLGLGDVNGDALGVEELDGLRACLADLVEPLRDTMTWQPASISSWTSSGWMPGRCRVPVSFQSQSRPPLR